MKKYLQILVILFFIFIAATAVFAQKATRISFYKNSTAATVSSSLRSYKDKKVFVIRVRKGQTLIIEQIKADASLQYVAVSIKSPSGEMVGDSDASCNNQKEIAPTEAGDYTITVFQCRKADEWRGRFKLKVAVK